MKTQKSRFYFSEKVGKSPATKIRFSAPSHGNADKNAAALVAKARQVQHVAAEELRREMQLREIHAGEKAAKRIMGRRRKSK